MDKFGSGYYKKELSPVFTMKGLNQTGEPVPRLKTQIILVYLRIVNLDPQAQEMAVIVDFSYRWPDLRLRWDPADYGGLDVFWLKADQVWFPENVISDVQAINDMTPENQRQVKVFSNGSVWYYFATSARAACQMDVRVFPFDTQDCTLGFSVLTYNPDFVTSTSELSPNFLTSQETGNGEWVVKNVSTFSEMIGGQTFAYEYVGFNVQLKRQPQYYVFVIILPCFVLTMLSIVGMFWNAHVKEEKLTKLSIGLTSMMSMTLLLDMMSKEIPKTATFPLLGFYVIFSIATIALGCAVVVIVSSPSQPHKKKPLSDKLRDYLSSKTFVLQFAFQLLNAINFIVLMSFWWRS
ncbi:unnamed protein product, partial [Mesorhabditis spiculigera]